MQRLPPLVTPYQVLQSNRPKISDTVAGSRAIPALNWNLGFSSYGYGCFKSSKSRNRQRTEINWHKENLRVFLKMMFLSLLPKQTFYHFTAALVLPPPGLCTFRPAHVQPGRWLCNCLRLWRARRCCRGRASYRDLGTAVKSETELTLCGRGAWRPSFHNLFCAVQVTQIAVI